MRENPYPGINAHLNSLLQTPGTREQTAIWPSFHSNHIAHIVDALNEGLPSQYLALGEQSLQTRDLDMGGAIEVRHPVPDVSVYQRGQSAMPAGEVLILTPTWEGRVVDVFEPMPQPKAVIIRELLPQGKLGNIVTRIELLSPSNKPSGSNYTSYAAKRVEAIDTGVPLVEIDYLHESPSLILQLPVYPSQANAYPYSIIVSDPRPNWSEGKVRVYGFGLRDAIRAFPVPLAGDETIVFDLNPVYQHTFRAGRWGDLLDYRAAPERFETYSVEEQEFIRRVMDQVVKRV
jgi:Protein of unknown function (DUF4058)